MVRFSCFSAHNHSHKSKKTVQPSVEAMYKALRDSAKLSPKAMSTNSLLLKTQAYAQSGGSTKDITKSATVERGWKSEEIKGKLNIESDLEVHQTMLKKSQSLGSELCRGGRVCSDNDAEDEVDQGFSSDSYDHNGLVGADGSKNRGISPPNHHQRTPKPEPVLPSCVFVNNESMFSIGDHQHSEKGTPENSDSPLSGECVNEIGYQMPYTHSIVKSRSLPYIGPSTATVEGFSYKKLAPHSRSSEDLHVLYMRMKENLVHEIEMQVKQGQERDDHVCRTEKINVENPLDEGYDSYDYSALAKDWIMPVIDEDNLEKNFEGECSIQQWGGLPNKDFRIKRIEEWVNNLQHCCPLEETSSLPDTNQLGESHSTVLSGLNVAEVDAVVTPGMEAVKKYISSLSASSTAAQLSNHGLTVIPFLSAFVSLKVLNLSGNSIARITAGALPRGLHALNLSKNNISTIEGLRELTRLRVLDLSYNKIFRIGHGLASCSSLKELYLAGNKISEVEGLHRLLKLTVLDLRFNKISTAKCLGQLAANYNSLQAISLEGNPAQKNVGDEQLKKYLQSLLSHLVYFNRQPIKAKDVADRSVRLGISSHQYDRGLRSDNKTSRKASHGLSGTRTSSASTHGRKSQAMISPMPSSGRPVRLPPSGTKATSNHKHRHFDISSRIPSFSSDLSIRRSRSEGTLGPI